MATVATPPPQAQPATGPAARPNWVQRNHFILRRLHSLTGIVPIGGFLLFHFYENAAIFYGGEAYDEMSHDARSIRFIEVIEVLVVFLPLLYHAIYGLFIAGYARNNTMTYNYSRNNLFMWQRATGIIILLFLMYHIWHFRLTQFWFGEANTASVMTTLAYVPTLVFYIVGVVASAFHLGNGIWTFLITWGITIGQRAQRISQIVTTSLSIVISLLGIAIALAFVQMAGGPHF
ncbi:MAG: succinate dehydrogenase [Chloroflexota bacterium]|nr:succinate dehydrogenase [Chloroflexota bacterium]MDQ5865285.1 succinate dehydrogenase [Chloroflexota bacterium]